ncbi:MAG: hypothetical protein JSS63_06855 [Bacteroidetes bacterium]|nr:hypothetical protein [Bacteroidota bacterium]
MSPKDITTFFLEIEKENNLFDWESGGVFVWQLVRTNLFGKILSAVKQEKINYKNDLIGRIFRKRYRVKNILFYNPFSDKTKSDVLIFESSRYLQLDGKYIDPYTKFLGDEILSKKMTLTRYQSNYSVDYLSEKNKNVKHLDYIEAKALSKAKSISFDFSEGDLSLIKILQKAFDEYFKINLDLKDIFLKQIKYFKAELPYYQRLLDIKKPKEIFFVDYNSKMAITCAAKERGIPVTEMQHGLMVSEDIIYHFPTVKEGGYRYFPDKFILWNDLWRKGSKLPIAEENIIIRENDFLKVKKSRYKNISKKKNTILISSQYGLTNEIAKDVLENLPLLKEYEIIYKLHPVEYSVFKTNELLQTLSKEPNVFFPDSKDDLHKFLAEAEIFIGVFSFVIFEAMEFGCKMFLLDLPGVSMVKFLVDNKHAVLIKSIKNIKENL